MEAWHQLGVTGLYLGCFGLSMVSALVPWVNGEVLLLTLAVPARSPFELLILVLLASAGQMAGKCFLYWAGRGAVRFQSGRMRRALPAWKERFERSPAKMLALVFVSSAVGIPPFYVITILAGAFRVRFGPFLTIGACGRIVRFTTLVFVPWIMIQWFR
jgi:membrane protein YqaA with SNARE-associated domain